MDLILVSTEDMPELMHPDQPSTQVVPVDPAALGEPVNPHVMRHAAITAVLDATNGDMRTTQKLSCHAGVRTLMIYDDNRSDLQGKATELLSELV